MTEYINSLPDPVWPGYERWREGLTAAEDVARMQRNRQRANAWYVEHPEDAPEPDQDEMRKVALESGETWSPGRPQKPLMKHAKLNFVQTSETGE